MAYKPDVQQIRAFLERDHHDLVKEIALFSQEEIEPLPACHDDQAARVQAREIMSLLGSAGWVRYAFPETCGGQGEDTDLRACSLIRETLAGCSPLADSVFALQCLGSMPIVLSGDKALQQRWLPGVIAGEAMAAFAMTEPGAGSDVVNMSTRARRKGEEYVIDGEKHLITNAGIADFYTVFAVTDPDSGHRGISCFLVPSDSPGLHFKEAQVLSEPHPLGRIAFEGCRVSAENLLGGEGEGFKLGMATLDRLRPTVAAAACGMAGRALQEAISFSRERHQFGQPVSSFQSIQGMLAEMAIELTAARMLVFQAAWEKDQGTERITIPAAKAKAYATEAAQRIIDKAVQILGGRGVLVDQIVDRLYRAIRPLRIYEGTTQVQHLIIARDLLKE